MTELHKLSTDELVERLQSGNVTSQQLVEDCLSRIDRFNGDLNAFSSVNREAALAQAGAVDQKRMTGADIGLLEGLPIGIKDNMCEDGVRTTCGSRMLGNYVPPYDAHVVERIRSEDGIIIGKLNMDEFAMGSSTETSANGITRNPHNQQQSPGGSSGGSAAAVAAGLVPLALGSDTGGSIRQPASFCGVVGLKPTYGRVSRYGLVAFASSLDQIGPLSRDVGGAARLLQSIAGHDKRDSTSIEEDVPDYLDELGAKDESLRIGVVDDHYGDGIDAEVANAVRSAIDGLAESGEATQSVELPHSKYSVATYYLIAPSEASSNLARYDGIHYGYRSESFDATDDGLVDLYCKSRGEGFGAEVKRRIMLGTYALSAGYYDAYYLKALKVRRRIRQDFDLAFQQVDVIASPVAPTPAFGIGEKSNDPLSMYLSDIYTISANLAGIPAISVPCGMSEDGLPIGIQLLAPTFNESKLLRVARQLEQQLKHGIACPC